MANPMAEPRSTMEHQVALADSDFQEQTTGHVPGAVTVVFSMNTLVVRLHGALSLAEKALAESPAGAAQVREFPHARSRSTCGRLERV
jgi:uncharacterized protein YbcI